MAIPTKPKAPKKKATSSKKKTSTTKRSTSSRTSSKKSSSSKSSSGGGGGGGIKKTQDKAQVKALESMLKSGFKKALNVKVGNVDRLYKQQDKILLNTYGAKVAELGKSRKDNEKSEADESFANLGNRARENQDLLAQAAEMGAGETDTIRSQLMAVRNWDANQGDVNRSYFDTLRSVNSAITDLNADTKNARANLQVQALGDKEQAYTNYYNQRVDTYTQLGNLYANPYSAAYSKKKTSSAYGNAAKEAAKAWKNPGVSSSILNWEAPVKAEEGKLNNTQAASAAGVKEKKRPEGSTLNPW